LIGVSLIGPIATQVNTAAAVNGALYNSSTWSVSVLNLVPGFFALGILGIGIAVNDVAQIESNLDLQNPEFRLKSSRGQDRSVNGNLEPCFEFTYARETDKGFHNKNDGRIYSPISEYNKMKSELTQKNIQFLETSWSCLNNPSFLYELKNTNMISDQLVIGGIKT
jgi:hypothetical protein